MAASDAPVIERAAQQTYLTRRQVEQELGLCGSKVRQLARDGVITAYRADASELIRKNGVVWKPAWLFEPDSVRSYKEYLRQHPTHRPRKRRSRS